MLRAEDRGRRIRTPGQGQGRSEFIQRWINGGENRMEAKGKMDLSLSLALRTSSALRPWNEECV